MTENVHNDCNKPLIESIGINCPIHLGNKFTKLNYQISESDTDAEPAESCSTKDNEKIENNSLKSLVANIKLISVIKEEHVDDYNEGIDPSGSSI